MTKYSKADDRIEEDLTPGLLPHDVYVMQPELLSEERTSLCKIRSVETQLHLQLTLTQSALESGGDLPARSESVAPFIPGYEIHTVLGRGGMGVVYGATHLQLDRPVAIKMLLAGSHASQAELLRFNRETRLTAGLQHPNIVQIFDVGEVDGRPYYTMELVEGGNLAEKLGGKPLEVREAAEILVVLCRAVQSAHDGGVVHRDIKPANILLTADGTPKISDFGLARLMDTDSSLTASRVMGTPTYMAPEQLAGNEIGASVDIYALGTMLYAMLTGQPPFRGGSISDLEHRLITEDPQPPSNSNSKVPRDLDTICLKCLRKDPKDRYLSASDLADDLERFLKFESIQARPVSRIEQWTRWVLRNPIGPALSVTAFALICLLMVLATQKLKQSESMLSEKVRLSARLESGLKLQRQGRYSEALAILGGLGDGGNLDLRQRIVAALTAMKLIEELETVSFDRIEFTQIESDKLARRKNADSQYKAIFEKLAPEILHGKPSTIAMQIRNSETKSELIAAFDDWAVCTQEPGRRAWLLDVSRLADSDPSGLVDRIRDPDTWYDVGTLTAFANLASPEDHSVRLLLAISDRMDDIGVDSIDFRRRIQRSHTDDYLANFSLANALRIVDSEESLRYYQAAIALRPKAARTHTHLGLALKELNRNVEAIKCFETALQVAPEYIAASVALADSVSKRSSEAK